MVSPPSDFTLMRMASHWLGTFPAMASPCQLLIETPDPVTAEQFTALVQIETKRIERKFSRYRKDNIIHQINSAEGSSTQVDKETAQLLEFANTCYKLSDGLFDVTSGVLRKIWKFDGSQPIPAAAAIERLLHVVGWEKVRWQAPQLTLRKGMEIDLGGIGKEYAVDRCFELLKAQTTLPFLLNFGGDLRVSGPRLNGQAWRVGVEDPTMQEIASKEIDLRGGAIATSGDSQRFLLHQGKRYSHILNPKTGCPVENAPRSVTVAAPTTIEAGMLATFASLHGKNAESFLQSQGVQHWVLR